MWSGCERGGGFFESLDGGARWEHRASNRVPFAREVAVTEEGTLIQAASNGTYRSVDGGQTWVRAFRDRALALHRLPGGVFYVFFDETWYRTTDEGETWEEGFLPGRIDAVAVAPSGRLLVSVGRTVHHSDDGGLTWAPAEEDLPSRAEVLAVGDDGVVWAPLYYYGVHRSFDGGKTWERTAYEGEFRYGDGAFAAGPPGVAVIAEDTEIHYTLDGGNTWNSGGEAVPRGGWPYVDVTALAVTSEHRVIAGTDARSVFTAVLPEVPLPTMAEWGAEEGAPRTALAVHPNPVRGEVTVNLVLGEPRETRVEVVDALGRLVTVVHEGWFLEGTHMLRFDGASLPPGVYVVRAIGDGPTLTRPLTIAR